MSRIVVNALSRVVAHRTSRRGLLARSALGATALAVAPVAFTMRPVSAHAAICWCSGSSCRCGDLCCDGFTDFCCKLTGENLCPPNTVVAGWWKADGTGFCDIGDSRRPRYYLDCNHLCDDGCGCGWSGICRSSCTAANCRCLEGCDSRSVDCTRFRYGQCSQDIACVGPIACRIVTCVPPWQWDGSCSEWPAATDNSTGSHDRPCLHDGFTDLAPNAYYVDAVAWAFEQGIATGYSSDIFGPHEPMLRWHMAVFLWRYHGEPEPLVSSHFSDVEGTWYADAVNWMADAGITSGTDGGLFDPEAPATRGQAIIFLWRLSGRPEPTDGPPPNREYPYPFDDVNENAYYREAAHWAVQVGITNGVGERTFGGESVVDRAQAITFLHRYDRYDMLTRPQATAETEEPENGDLHGTEDSERNAAAESESGVPV